MTTNELQFDILLWSEQTFPNSDLKAIAYRCMQGCDKLRAALNNSMCFSLDGWEEEALEEFSDIFILMAAWAGKQGYPLEDAILEKMEKNRACKWGEADNLGVIQHVEEIV